jgi:hypothetical protein
MKRDLVNTDGRQLGGTQNGSGQKSASLDLNVAEEREQEVQEQIAGKIKRFGNTRTAAETETDEFASALTSHQVREKLMSVKAQVDAAVEHQAQSGRISRYALRDSVCREDPW